jgi:hypothetical protein
MPEGLSGSMTAQDLIDIVDLLARQRPLLGVEGELPVRSWMLAAPFPNEDDRGLDLEHGPERSVDLKASYPGRDGPVRWRKVEAGGEGYLDLARLVERPDSMVAYLFAALDSPREQEAELVLGSDDGVKVWLNGELVHANHVHRAASPGQDRARVRLLAGRNSLLVKIDNGNGPSGLYLTVASREPVRPLPAD